MEVNVGTSPNPRVWRQMATAIAREYMLPHLLEEGTTTSSDIAQHHSSAISRHHYARNGGDIPMLTTDAVCEQRAASHAWHDIIGTGTNPPPLPVRLLRKASSSTFNPEELQRVVKVAIEEALSSVRVTGVSQAQQPLESQALATPVAIERQVLSDPPTPPPAQHNTPPGKSRSPPPLPALSQLFSPPQISSPPPGNVASEEMDVQPDPIPAPSSYGPVTMGKRKRVILISDGEEGEEAGGQSKTSQRSQRSQHLMADRASSLGLDSMADFIVSTSQESHLSPPPKKGKIKTGHQAVKNIGTVLVEPTSSASSSKSEITSEEWCAYAYAGLHRLFDNPSAEFKSREQWLLIMHVLSNTADVFGVLPTGGGKSAVWQIPGILQEDIYAIVVVPFVLALADQVESNVQKGIPSWKYKANEDPPLGTRYIFCQPEQYILPQFQT